MPSQSSKFVALTGSDRSPVPGTHRIGDANPDERLTVMIVLRPRTATPPKPAAGMVVSHSELAATRGAAPDDVDAVTAHVGGHGLSVDRVDVAARSITVSGTVAQFNEAFGVQLGRFAGGGAGDGGGSYRGRVGPVQVPETLAGVVTAVLGLDDRPQAQPHFRISAAPDGVQPHAAVGTFRPDEVGRLYQFPAGVNGTGQTVAIIELGGGFRPADITAYFAALGIKKPKVVAVGVDGARNAPVGDPSSADGEVLLDIDVVGAIAPGAVIAVYFGPNTTRGFYDAVAAAIHDTSRKPSAVSISWGGPESTWTVQALDVYDQLFADAAALGITITAASGDDGSGDRVADGKAHVDFPASSPNVLACGGTRITANGTSLQTETVWNNGPGKGATGGGVSDHFAVPAYQKGAGVPPSSNPGGRVGRGVPDVAGNADPQTGWQVRVDGHDLVFGGTSAVAPMWAALVALVNQQLGRRAGFLQPAIYPAKTTSGLRDITTGNNGAYHAGTGWDPCTGLGSPNGTELAQRLTTP